jgi:hypothetical protein
MVFREKDLQAEILVIDDASTIKMEDNYGAGRIYKAIQ